MSLSINSTSSNSTSHRPSQVSKSVDQIQPKKAKDLTANVLINLTVSNNLKKIREVLQTNPNLPITTIKDTRLYTLIHTACLNNQYEICETVITYAKDLGVSQSELKTWINSKTDEGFRAIHFASFKGNIKLINLLESYGADIYTKNNKGLNVIHIAAQGDQPVSIAYFKKQGLNIFEKDNNGSSALHWAAYFGMENATYYLTSWGCSPNEMDQQFGCTPLHLGVNSGNFKVVRRLLSKGANPKIRNKDGKLPLDLALDGEYEGIVSLLRGRGCLGCMGIKSGVKGKKSRVTFLFFVFLKLIITGSSALFLFPYISYQGWLWAAIGLLAFSWLTFLRVWIKNPGYINNKKHGNILNLLLKNDPHLVCSDCVIVKKERSKHCDVCNSCVSVFDHHCPWINNCVGARNYGSFIVFIFTMMITLALLTVTGIFHFKDIETSDPQNVFVNLRNSLLPTKLKEHFQMLKYGTCGLIFLLELFFGIPLIGLNYLHFQNLVSGKTTNERFAFIQVKGSLPQSRHSSFNVIDRRYSKAIQKPNKCFQWCSNCTNMCCNNARQGRYVSMKSDYEIL